MSATERWDREAARVKRGRGRYVLLLDTRGRNDKVKEALERRGLFVEVRSRSGDGSVERPWVGVKTWARTI